VSDRRLAREIVVQSLYEMAQSGVAWKRALDANVERREARPAAAEYAERLLREIDAEREAIRACVEQALTHWSLDRLALVDRCVLEMATTEILHFADIPTAVSIDEAVSIVHKFGAAESGAFVNGVLDRIARDAAGTPGPPDGSLRVPPSAATSTPSSGESKAPARRRRSGRRD
jgi:N utilization substance protein B